MTLIRFRRQRVCGEVSPPIRFDQRGPARRVTCCLEAGHPAVPGWPRLHVSADGVRFTLASRFAITSRPRVRVVPISSQPVPAAGRAWWGQRGSGAGRSSGGAA